jgi:hypothetical protein
MFPEGVSNALVFERTNVKLTPACAAVDVLTLSTPCD